MVSKSHVSDINFMNTEIKINTTVPPTDHFNHIFPAFSLALFNGSPDPSIAASRHRHTVRSGRPKRSHSKQRIF